MEVVVIGCRGFPEVSGGIEKHCEELYTRIVKSNSLNVTVLSIKRYQKLKVWKGIKFINIFTCGSSNVEKIMYGLLSTIYVCFKRPDVVHYQGLNSAIFIPLAKLFRLKIVYTQHSQDYLYPKWGEVAKKILKWAERVAMMSDIVIAVSKTIFNYLKHEYKIENLLFIANGVDLNAFTINHSHDEAVFREYGLKKNNYILFVGRITPEKGIEILIDAYKLLETDMKLVIVGKFIENDSYSLEIRKKCLNNLSIILTGSLFQSDLATLYMNCRLFVLPSRFEGLPIALLEAISCGCQVLASNIPPNKELNLGDEYYFSLDNIPELSSKLALYCNIELDDLEKKRRAIKLKNFFDWDNVAAKTVEIYKCCV